jgi:hypothetical protein
LTAGTVARYSLPMLSQFRLPMVVLGAVVANLVAAQTPQPNNSPLPIQDFFRPALVTLPIVNRAGTRLAVRVATADDHKAGLLFNLVSNKQQIVRGFGDRDIDQIVWLDDKHVLLSESQEKLYADALQVVDADGKAKGYAIERFSAVELISVPKSRPMQPIIWMRQDAFDELNDAGAMQIDGGKSVDSSDDISPLHINDSGNQAVERNGTAASILFHYPKLGPGFTEGYLADKNGELAFGITMDGGIQHLYFLKKDRWIKSPMNLDETSVFCAGDVPEEVIAIGPRQDAKPRALLRVDAATGTVKGTLYQDDRYDPILQAIVRNPSTGAIAGIQYYRRALETVWIDPVYQQLQAKLSAAFPRNNRLFCGERRKSKPRGGGRVFRSVARELLSNRFEQGQHRAYFQKRAVDPARADAEGAAISI